ncbi:MAG: NTP transferase domain-containing protein [Bacteroidaceae bacterium]|nr:NTP transferase domain-containing protein [Bacteroidaceae bacterium]
MKAMIFAAGLGTRLKPITDRMPKALVPVDGQPLLQILLEKLQAAGYDDLVINVHHFADTIEAWCQGRPGIRFSDERAQLLETGGGIRHAAPLLADADSFLIHNVDILSNVRLRDFAEAGKTAEVTLLVSERATQRYLLFDEAMRLVGWTNVKTGEVRSPYPHLDPSRYRHLAFAGIHQMSSALLPLMDNYPDKFSIIDFYLQQCAEHTIRGYVQPDLRMMDVGKLGSLDQAADFLNSLDREI